MEKVIYKQNAKSPVWIDEAGNSIPYNRITSLERLKERKSFTLLTKSKMLSQKLVEFKQEVQSMVDEVIDAARAENAVKLEGKGNYTFYNFNRTIKIEVNVNELIRFDDMTIEAAKETLLNLIRTNIQGDDFIISIVEDAFQNSRGRLDAKKVLGLKRHGQRIKSFEIKAEWDKAMDLIDKSISRPKTKTYYKVWFKDGSGDYIPVELNFSNI